MKLTMKLTFSHAGNITELVRRQVVFEKLGGFYGRLPSVQNPPGNPHGGPPGQGCGGGGGGGGGGTSTWVTVASFTTARAWHGGGGAITSAVVFGGETDQTETAYTNSTQEYNGNIWLGGGNMLAARGGLTGCGTRSAALVMAGRTAITTDIATVDVYNGNSWSNTTSLNVSRRQSKGCGTTTNAFNAGGWIDGGPGAQTTTQSFNGAAWTAGGQFNGGNFLFFMWGTPTDAYKTGGNSSGYKKSTEGYNGTVWAAGQDMLVNRAYHAGSGTGQTNGIVAAGYDGATVMSSSEKFTTVWASLPNVNAARYAHFGVGNGSTSLITGGYDTGTGCRTSAEVYS